MKKILITLLAITLLIPTMAMGALGDKAEQRDPSKLQTLGANMIDKRITSINTYTGFLGQTKFISDATKNETQSELGRIKDELSTLKTKIQGETDLQILREDVKSIVTNYRVYQVSLPRAAGLVSVDRMKAYSAKLDEASTKIEAKAKELETQGKDITEITALISTARTSISAGNSSTDDALSKFSAMSISNPEGALGLRIEGRTSLGTSRKSFSDARVNLRDAVQKIKSVVQAQ
jgi:hypothetical protein